DRPAPAGIPGDHTPRPGRERDPPCLGRGRVVGPPPTPGPGLLPQRDRGSVGPTEVTSDLSFHPRPPTRIWARARATVFVFSAWSFSVVATRACAASSSWAAAAVSIWTAGIARLV